jgi:tRNA threonylcarbamoyladenosine biosynthesis protein TsaE
MGEGWGEGASPTIKQTQTMLTFQAKNEHDTEQLGDALASVLPAGAVVGLIGPLGAGKTRLVQAFAKAVGVPPGTVTSPTFVLVNEYCGGRMPVFHFDTYRLKDDDEFLNLGPEEYFESNGITFVEWADRVTDLLPDERIEITIEASGPTERHFSIRGTCERLEKIIEQISRQPPAPPGVSAMQ